MFSLKQCRARPTIVFRHPPWPPSPTTAPCLDPRQPIEEEKTPYYHPSQFYPARLGQILNDRYQLATKLGYGSSSTVWLARDLHCWRWSRERYVAIKINTSNHHTHNDAAENELAILQHISRMNRSHEGWNFVRRLLDSFTIEGVSGQHLCLVLEPLREPLWLYRRRFIGGVVPSDVLKITVQMILHGLDYLHSDCQIIHTDLKPDNVLVKFEDPTILERDVRDEYQHPLPQKLVTGRTIYLSRNNYGPFLVPTGVVQIADSGLSVLGTTSRNGCIQAEIYRTPEVVLDAGYTYSADIWSFGVMLWDLLEGKALFSPVDTRKDGDYDDHIHLAQMTALMGPPPEYLLARGRRTSKFFYPNGQLKSLELVPKDFSFENAITMLSSEEKSMFIGFVKKNGEVGPGKPKFSKGVIKGSLAVHGF
ncbi:protein kinase [Lineolata rhizophorae]|uniref:non-specific serine/threonine protein kinase n=1 Tax=Lineolata rhizophorae TaxID=578093 RepID=A0A6A6NX64_9PEZI|nr:protein kinase [Lineolata rhizophorae]